MNASGSEMYHVLVRMQNERKWKNVGHDDLVHLPNYFDDRNLMN